METASPFLFFLDNPLISLEKALLNFAGEGKLFFVLLNFGVLRVCLSGFIKR